MLLSQLSRDTTNITGWIWAFINQKVCILKIYLWFHGAHLTWIYPWACHLALEILSPSITKWSITVPLGERRKPYFFNWYTAKRSLNLKTSVVRRKKSFCILRRYLCYNYSIPELIDGVYINETQQYSLCLLNISSAFVACNKLVWQILFICV